MKNQLLLSAVSAAALLAQAPSPGVLIEMRESAHVIAGAPAAPAGALSFVTAEMGFEMGDVKGVPFTGDFVSETVQTLADGNRIKSSNTTSYARDGEGRSRREMSIGAIGPWAGTQQHKSVFIHDPVSKIDYVLDPQAKTARKINIGAMASKAGSSVSLTRKIETINGETKVVEEKIEGPVAGPKKVMVFHGNDGGKTEFAGGESIAFTPAERIALPGGLVFQGDGKAATNAPNVKTEQLGKRIIEGVEAEGTRTTVTIPAGQIGNELPLDTVSERWYSNELKTVVLTTRKDPRSGETSYRLTNLRRGEPARQLFEVPGDFKVTEGGGDFNIIRLRKEEK
jgi:hypothetical protein